MNNISVIITAGGTSSRYGKNNKRQSDRSLSYRRGDLFSKFEGFIIYDLRPFYYNLTTYMIAVILIIRHTIWFSNWIYQVEIFDGVKAGVKRSKNE